MITLGNHAWDQREIYIQEEPRLIRPLNYPETTPGAGVGSFQRTNGAQRSRPGDGQAVYGTVGRSV